MNNENCPVAPSGRHGWVKGTPKDDGARQEVCPFCDGHRTPPPEAPRVLGTPSGLSPVLRHLVPRPQLADPRIIPDLKRASYRSPDEHNAELTRRYGRRARSLDRDETVALYGWPAALQLFPVP